MYKRGDNIMEKGLKWLFGGLIAAVVMMFILMVSSVDAQTVRFGDGEHGHYWQSQSYRMTSLTALTPQQIDNVVKQNEIKRRWQTNYYHHPRHHNWHGGTHRQMR